MTTTPVLGILQALAMMILPFAVAHFFSRRHGFSWKLAGIGAAFFLLAQVFKGATLIIPLKIAGISASAFAGTFAYGFVAAALPGFWEELLKYWPMKSFMRDKTWRNAVVFGLGFGGIEAFYLGFQVLMIAVLASTNPAVLPPELKRQFAAAFTPTMIGTAVLAVLERLAAISLHVAFAVLNWKAIAARNLKFLGYAMVSHFILDLGPAFYQIYGHELGTAGFLLVEAWAYLGALLALRYTVTTGAGAG